MVLLVTGLPSAAKERFVDILSRRVGGGVAVISWLHGVHPEAVLHVHAESDVEALDEGRRTCDRQPDVVVRVDWEPADACAERVLHALQRRVEGART